MRRLVTEVAAAALPGLVVLARASLLGLGKLGPMAHLLAAVSFPGVDARPFSVPVVPQAPVTT